MTNGTSWIMSGLWHHSTSGYFWNLLQFRLSYFCGWKISELNILLAWSKLTPGNGVIPEILSVAVFSSVPPNKCAATPLWSRFRHAKRRDLANTANVYRDRFVSMWNSKSRKATTDCSTSTVFPVTSPVCPRWGLWCQPIQESLASSRSQVSVDTKWPQQLRAPSMRWCTGAPPTKSSSVGAPPLHQSLSFLTPCIPYLEPS